MERTNRTVRRCALAGALLIAAGSSGCTAEEPAGQPAASSTSTSPPPTTEPRLQDVAVEWTALLDEESGPGGSSLSPVLNERGRGPARFLLPDMAPYHGVRMTLICQAPSGRWTVDLEVADGSVTSSTSEPSCAAETGVYVTPVDSANLPVAVGVEVPANTDYYVLLYGEPIAGAPAG